MSDNKLICPRCPDSYSSKYTLIRYLKNIHKFTEAQIQEIFPPENEFISCHICRKKVSAKAQLIDHLRADHNIDVKLEKISNRKR